MTFESALAETVRTFESLREIAPEIQRAGDLILQTLQAGNKLLIFGNGGSAAEAQHFSSELVGRYSCERRSLPAIALTTDASLLTSLSNDFGFEHVFARQFEGLAQPGDLVIAISSSGNSPNIVAALEAARKRQLPSISFSGRGGGQSKGLATVDLIVPGTRGRTAQEAHLFLIHHFCDRIDAAFA